MGQAIELRPEEQVLADGVRDLLELVKRRISAGDLGGDLREHIAEMGAQAHRLHELLRERDPELEPRHHKYMVRNRGMSARDRYFYEHVHPVEDLLEFLADRDANADPVDQTVGATFRFRVYSRRWGRHDSYHIERTRTGWRIEHMAIGGECNKEGEPGLFANFRQDNINYPAALPGYFGWLWEQASEEGVGLTKEQVQDALDALAKWVSDVERGSPEGIFGGFK